MSKEMPTPKYHINDSVFVLAYNKVEQVCVRGIYSIFEKRDGPFKEYKYCFESVTEISRYGWVSESDVFPSRQSLLESL